MKGKKALAVLLLAAGLVYANSLFSGFVWDDKTLIIQKQAFFSQPGSIAKVLLSCDAPLGVKDPYYRPFSTLTYMLDHYLWGLNPFWYHLENVLLHALVVMLFYLLLAAVFKDRRLAFFAALLFAVYPVNAEAVNAVFNRNALLCAAFSLASLLFLAKGKKSSALLAYSLALMSKEPAVVLPFFLFSYALTADGLEAGKEKIRKNWMAIAGFFAVTAAYFAVRRLALGVFTSAAGLGFSMARLKLMAAVYFEHFRLFVFPFRLNASYTEKALMSSFSVWRAAGAGIGMLLLVYFSLARKAPAPVRAGAQWIFWGLLPVSNLVRIPSAPVAERYQYTIVFGFVLVLGYLAAELSGKRAGKMALALVAAFTLALGVRTFERNFTWKGNTSLFSGMIRSDPENAEAYVNLGTVYGGEGDTVDAIREFRAACALGDPRAWMNLGIAHTREGRTGQAIVEFKKALALRPGFARAMAHLGVAYYQAGFLAEAESEFKAALALAPGLAKTRVNLGTLYARENRSAEAVSEFRKALALDPGLDLARMYLGIIYMKNGRLDEASREFRTALALNPGNSQALQYLDRIENQGPDGEK